VLIEKASEHKLEPCQRHEIASVGFHVVEQYADLVATHR
jgi:hypothetical protein